MKSAGMSVDELARRSGLNRRSLDKYFFGDSPSPSFFMIAAIVEQLEDLRLEELAYEQPPPVQGSRQ